MRLSAQTRVIGHAEDFWPLASRGFGKIGTSAIGADPGTANWRAFSVCRLHHGCAFSTLPAAFSPVLAPNADREGRSWMPNRCNNRATRQATVGKRLDVLDVGYQAEASSWRDDHSRFKA